MVSNHIAIILARGGSKRLPGKNILDFHGKPMLAWTVEAALRSEQFDRVLLSTDDPVIADIGKKYGAEVPFLRDVAADDHATSSEATLVALGQAENHWSEKYEVVTQLMANCPLRNAIDIKNAVNNFMGNKAPSQISCFRYGWMNPWWAAKLDSQGVPEYLFPETRLSRSQDLPPLYCPTGAIWIAEGDRLKDEQTYYMPNHIEYPLSWISAVDIDDIEDMDMARAAYMIRPGQEDS